MRVCPDRMQTLKTAYIYSMQPLPADACVRIGPLRTTLGSPVKTEVIVGRCGGRCGWCVAWCRVFRCVITKLCKCWAIREVWYDVGDMELKRQMKLQEANRLALQDALSTLSAEYDAAVGRAVEAEEAALKDEERFVTC